MLFVAVASVAVGALLWLLGGNGRLRNVEYHLGHPDHTYTRASEAMASGDVDVLFVGSSHSYRTFDPRQFAAEGVSIFNLGSSNQTPEQSEVLLRRYLGKIRPRLVVVEVHPDIMTYDGIESSLYWLSNAPPSWHNVGLLLRTANAKVWCTAVYSTLHNTFSSAFRHFEEPTCGETGCYVSGGFVERDMECWQPAPQPLDTICPLKRQCRALERIVNMLHARGIECLLVEVPDTKMQEHAYSNLDEFRSAMQQYAPLIYPRPEGLDDSLHYYDPMHLNQHGVELYSKTIIPAINEYLRTDVGHVARRRGSRALHH